MRMYDIIMKKRDGLTLTKDEIEYFVNGYVRGEIPDYQASALCMAIWFRGMSDDETAALTYAMAQSGDTLDLSRFGTLSVDKHSTGGVGDKTTLVVAPVAACLGAKVAKMSGRGLGHTGGTVDKLESIPGFRVVMPRDDFMRQVENIGVAVIGQSGNLTPADKSLYALRDVTATVDSIPLITSSIMSKKLAAGSHNIVLDVKAGSGAFMKTPDSARELARKMVAIGKACGRNIAALITDMNRPLGAAVGNILEVVEAVRVLRGEEKGELYDVCAALATEMLSLAKDIPHNSARKLVIEAIDSGAAYAKMKEWIAAQGGDVRYIENPDLFLKDFKPAFAVPVLSPLNGYISAMDSEKIGSAAVILGAGRSRKDEEIDYSAGIMICAKTGDKVQKGQVLATLYTNRKEAAKPAARQYSDALTFGAAPPKKEKLIYDIIR